MLETIKPGLFGLEHSNRDFASAASWGKNQFNSSFPAALACWMGFNSIKPVYLRLQNNILVHESIAIESLFGFSANNEHLFFSFEDVFTPYTDLIIGKTPRADLVTRNSSKNSQALSAFEIKLTALPDSTTFNKKNEQFWGCEIVVRPDTIVYIALSIADAYRNSRAQLLAILQPASQDIADWTDGQEVAPQIPRMVLALETLFQNLPSCEIPLLMQPIFKTLGKKSTLAESCFDIFVWSNLAISKLFFDQSKTRESKITRPERSSVWLFKMLLDYGLTGKINAENIKDSLTYNTKNDKAFACAGSITNPYMKSPQLENPRIPKMALREIILGGGQNFLSPERRLDAIIVNTPGLFDS